MVVNKTVPWTKGAFKASTGQPANPILPCLWTPQTTPLASVSTVTVADISDDSSLVGSKRICLKGTEEYGRLCAYMSKTWCVMHRHCS